MGDYDRLSFFLQNRLFAIFCLSATGRNYYVQWTRVIIFVERAGQSFSNVSSLPTIPRLSFAKKVHRLANPQKNRHERQRWQSASRAGNGVRGQPPNLVKNFAVSLEFQARLLKHNSQARTRRRKTRRNLRKRRLHDCLFLWPLRARERERERERELAFYVLPGNYFRIFKRFRSRWRADACSTRSQGDPRKQQLSFSTPLTRPTTIRLDSDIKRVPRMRNMRWHACRKLWR